MKNSYVIGFVSVCIFLLVGCSNQVQPQLELELIAGETPDRHPLSILYFAERSLLQELEPGQAPCLHGINYYANPNVHYTPAYELRYIVDAHSYTVIYWQFDGQISITKSPWDQFQPNCYTIDPNEIKIWPEDIMAQYGSEHTISGMRLFTDNQAQALKFQPHADYWWSMISMEDILSIDVRDGHMIHSFRNGSMVEK